MVGPSATASEKEKNGMPRFAFTDPSIGSTTTLQRPPAPKVLSPSSSETSTKSSSSADEPRDDRILGRLVDRSRVVATLARGAARARARLASVAVRAPRGCRRRRAGRSRARVSSRRAGGRRAPRAASGRSTCSSAACAPPLRATCEHVLDPGRAEEERGVGAHRGRRPPPPRRPAGCSAIPSRP